MILTRTEVHDFALGRHLAVSVHLAERQRQPLAAARGPSSLPHPPERGTQEREVARWNELPPKGDHQHSYPGKGKERHSRMRAYRSAGFPGQISFDPTQAKACEVHRIAMFREGNHTCNSRPGCWPASAPSSSRVPPSIVGIASPVFAAGPGPNCLTTNTPVAGTGGTAGGNCEITATIQVNGARHRDRLHQFQSVLHSSTANRSATTPPAQVTSGHKS
jgi:hypothetical protein